MQDLSKAAQKKKTVAQRKEHFDDVAKMNETFATASKALSLLDITKTQNRTFSTFSKEKLRNYMKNPYSNMANLRKLSQFLYRLSFQYRRLISYNASMIDLKAHTVIPLTNLVEEESPEDLKGRYYEALKKVQQMSLEEEIYKLLTVAWREDAVYGYVYDDGQDFFIHILDGEFCQISSVEDGVFNFAFNFDYFKNNEYDLENWDPEFKKKFQAYDKDSKLKWQELDPNRTICLKVNPEDPTLCMPPFVALFDQIIDLIDLQSIQSVKDELSIYKLLVAKLETRNNAEESNLWKVDINTAIEYFNRLSDELPEAVSAVLSLFPIEPIEFKGNTTEDVDMVANAMSNLFINSGGSQVLNNKNLTGTAGYEAAHIADAEMAISSLLPQIQKWTNKYLRNWLKDDFIKVHYIEVTPFTRKAKRKELVESAQNGVPVKMAIAALDGFSQLETISMQLIENDILQLQDNWVPLSTSYTMSGKSQDTDPVEGGRPQQDDLTDEGASTRDGEKNE